jgi:hypothetical protein
MSNIEIYKSPDNKIELQVNLDNETVWLTQQQMSLLFNQTKQNISLHINNCFKEAELRKDSVVKESLTIALDGKSYSVQAMNYSETKRSFSLSIKSVWMNYTNRSTHSKTNLF